MATLANIFNQFMDAGRAAEAAQTMSSRVVSDDFKLRSLPNEDVYFFVKRIDNSRVVRQADPMASAKSWKVLGASCVSAAMLIGMLLPSAYGLLASYQLHTLQAENQRLNTERGKLDLEEAKLVSPERLARLAVDQEFEDPKSENVVYLTPANEGSLAMNRR
jgi:cell division protein FtsL